MFMQLRVGMTPANVEALVGAPLDKITHKDGSVLWMYSGRENNTCDYELRNVFFREGRVTILESFHWEE